MRCTLRRSSTEPVRMNASLSTPLLSQLKNISQSLERERKKKIQIQLPRKASSSFTVREKTGSFLAFPAPKNQDKISGVISPCSFSMKSSRGTDPRGDSTDVVHVDHLFLVQAGKGLLKHFEECCWKCRFCLQRHNSGGCKVRRGVPTQILNSA